MGATGSIVDCEKCSAEDVGEFVDLLGAAYKPYKALIVDNGVCGKTLKDTKPEELKELLNDIGITKALHCRVLMSHLKSVTGSNATKDKPADQEIVHTNTTPFKEHDVVVGEKVTVSPREIMTKLFEIQGIPLDPADIESTVQKVKGVVGTGYGNGIDKYDCFINYRVAADADIAEKLYLYLKSVNIHAFLDKKCLKNGEKWKDGFLNGLKRSKCFIALISKSALAKVRDAEQDHTYDNVLLEYETALNIKEKTNNAQFICPLHVGAITVVPAIQQAVLVKFADFNPMLYPDSIVPIKKDATEIAEAKAKKEEKVEKQKKIESERMVELETIDVCCQNCDCPISGPRVMDEELNGEKWSCDWPGHDGGNEFVIGEDPIYGCDDFVDCDWAICQVCFENLKTASELVRNGKTMEEIQPDNVKSIYESNAAYACTFEHVLVTPHDDDDGVDVAVQYDSKGDGSEFEIGAPSTANLLVGDDKYVQTKFVLYTMDSYQITGAVFFTVPSLAMLQNNKVQITIDDSYSYCQIFIPGSTLVVEEAPESLDGPVCDDNHEMFVTDYRENEYCQGYCCNICSENKDGERWFCKEDCTDICFTCHPKPNMKPECDNGHKCIKFKDGKTPRSYLGGVVCDVCGKGGLSYNVEYYHCDDCSYDICLSCAYLKAKGKDQSEYSDEVITNVIRKMFDCEQGEVDDDGDEAMDDF